MPMIQGIDGGMLMQAFRAGRQDRFDIEDRMRQMRAEDAEARRKDQVSGLVGQLFGQREQPAGVAAQFGAPGPRAFGGGGHEATHAPETAPQAPPQMPVQAPSRQPNPDVLAQLILLDPETGQQVVSALKSMDEMDLKRSEARNNFMGAAARYVMQGATAEERLERFQIATPALLDAGYTAEELDGIDNDLSDARLQFYMATAIDYDKLIDNELAERQFNAGKTVPVPGGGSVALVKPDGSAEWIIGGSDGGDSNLPRPQSKAEVDALPPGARFIAPDGTIRAKPGGPTPQASGGFPAGQ